MNIEIPQNIGEVVKGISKKTGSNEAEIVIKALKLYLSSIKKHTLKEEIDAWEMAGDEDFKF